MSLSINAEESDANQSKFYKVLSSKPVTNADVLFDTLSKFLTKDKKRQIEMEFLDEKDLISSRLTWNNIRNVANAVIEEGGSRRDPIPAWIEQKEAIVVDETPNTYSGNDDADVVKEESKDESSDDDDGEEDVKTEANAVAPEKKDETKDDKKAAKKAKKEAKEARKRERAEKREAKKIKREEKEAKRLKKEAKKRKREE